MFVSASGTYHHRGQRIYPYLRDYVFPDIQKFNKALRIVETSEPSGVNANQKLGMAIAIHLEYTNKMDYKYIDLDKGKWKHYKAWRVLCMLPKFRFNNSKVMESVTVDTTQESDAIQGMIVMGESPANISSISWFSKNSKCGRDKSKSQFEKQKYEKRKFDEIEQNKKTNNTILDKLTSLEAIMSKKAKLKSLKLAAEVTNDSIKKEEYHKKIVELNDLF